MSDVLRIPSEETLARPRGVRLRVIDVVRGVAIAGVVVYHLVWDLDFTGLAATGISRQLAWTLLARTLAGTFMLLVGVSLFLAHRNGMRWRAFGRRLGVLALAALAISVVTRLVFPQTFIYFGILHSIAAASLMGVFVLRLPAMFNILAGITIIVLPFIFRDAWFDPRWLAWIGFAEQVPPSNDFVPIFPWAGLTLLGIGVANFALAQSAEGWLNKHEPSGGTVNLLAWLGRHSLAIYLIHQPILLSIIIPLASWSN